MHKVVVSLGLLVAAVSLPTASAHHSPVMFDQSKAITLSGTVRQFQWTNPHCYIQLVVEDGGRRPLPAEDDRWPTVWGESIGRWEGDTLVIETVSVSEPLSYVFFGPAFSSRARYTERIRMTGPDRIENEMTIVDPERLTAPWTATMVYVRAEGLDRLIHDASTNDRDAVQGDLLTILPPAAGE